MPAKLTHIYTPDSFFLGNKQFLMLIKLFLKVFTLYSQNFDEKMTNILRCGKRSYCSIYSRIDQVKFVEDSF